MCTIAVSTAGQPQPSFNKLQRGFNRNIDGAGYAFVRDGLVHIRKGYFDWKGWKKAIKNDDIQPAEAAIYHARLGTDGLCDEENTQPFVVTSDLSKLSLGAYANKAVDAPVFAHNGVFQDFRASQIHSDSAMFVLEVVSEIAYMLKNNKGVLALYEAYHSLTNKSVLLYPDNTCLLFGKGWHEIDGVKWSNDDYAPSSRQKVPGFGSPTIQESVWMYCDTCDNWLTGPVTECPRCKTELSTVTDESREDDFHDDFGMNVRVFSCTKCGHMEYEPDGRSHMFCPFCNSIMVEEFDGEDPCFCAVCGFSVPSGHSRCRECGSTTIYEEHLL